VQFKHHVCVGAWQSCITYTSAKFAHKTANQAVPDPATYSTVQNNHASAVTSPAELVGIPQLFACSCFTEALCSGRPRQTSIPTRQTICQHTTALDLPVNMLSILPRCAARSQFDVRSQSQPEHHFAGAWVYCNTSCFMSPCQTVQVHIVPPK
jgi:hypothetical protein